MQTIRPRASGPDAGTRACVAGVLFWLFLSGVPAALLLPLTQALAAQQDADGLLTALISTRRLTWYFWEQDRFLNLIPALAKAFDDPATNLHVQVFLRAWMTYLSPLAILVFFTQSTRTLVLGVAVTNAILIAGMSFYGWFNLYVQHNPFGTSLVLFAVAYLVASRPSPVRWSAAAALCWFAYATNLALLVFTGPFLLLLLIFRQASRARLFWFGVANGAAILAAVAHSTRIKVARTKFGIEPSVEAFAQAMHVLGEQLNAPAVLLVIAVCLFCIATLRLPAGDKRALLRDLSAPVASAALAVVLLSMTVWVRMNDFNVRYYLTAGIVIATVMAYLIVLRLMQAGLTPRHVGGMVVAAYVALLFGPMGGFTGNYRELARADRHAQSVAVAQAAMDTETTMIIGSFWDVWPAVYETQRLRHERTSPVPIYGGAERGSPLGREFRAWAIDGREQRALCFFTSVEACLAETHLRLHLTAEERLAPTGVRSVTLAGKPMLDIGFRLVSGS
jgi:hypothetical protein